MNKITLLALFITSITVGCFTNPTPVDNKSDISSTNTLQEGITKTSSDGLSLATVEMNTSQGMIKFKFYPKDAPKTVARIAELIQQKFYNGLTFHRVIPGFVAQGGDPSGTGAGGSGKNIPAEFNSQKHTEGAVAMARASDPNSADSQFYISLGVHPHLDNQYTVFGRVVEGLDVAKRLKVGDKIIEAKISQ